MPPAHPSLYHSLRAEEGGARSKGSILIGFCWLGTFFVPFYIVSHLTAMGGMSLLTSSLQYLFNSFPLEVIGGLLLAGFIFFELFFFIVLRLAHARWWVYIMHVMVVVGLGLGSLATFHMWSAIYDQYFAPKYDNYDARAAEALKYCKSNGLRTDYCIFVDFSMRSCDRRFMVYDLQKKEVKYGGLVAHGKGAPSTPQKAAFSNMPGSKCSSLGKYHIGQRAMSDKVGRHYKLSGKNFFTNGNAAARGIFIHTSRTVNAYENILRGNLIPLGSVSEGFFTVSSSTFNYLEDELDAKNPKMLLWAFDGQNG